MSKNPSFLGKTTRPSRTSYQRANRNTRRVTLLRQVLPVTAFIILATLFGWPLLKDVMTPDLPELPKLDKSQILQNKVVAPRMHSKDRHGHDFSIAADAAVKTSDTDTVTHLEKPKAQMHTDGQGPMKVQAFEGDYDQKENVLHYNQDVTIETGDGFVLKTEKADVQVHDKKAVGVHPVKGQGPAGDVQSDQGFEATKDQITFKGQTKMIIKQGNK